MVLEEERRRRKSQRLREKRRRRRERRRQAAAMEKSEQLLCDKDGGAQRARDAEAEESKRRQAAMVIVRSWRRWSPSRRAQRALQMKEMRTSIKKERAAVHAVCVLQARWRARKEIKQVLKIKSVVQVCYNQDAVRDYPAIHDLTREVRHTTEACTAKTEAMSKALQIKGFRGGPSRIRADQIHETVEASRFDGEAAPTARITKPTPGMKEAPQVNATRLTLGVQTEARITQTAAGHAGASTEARNWINRNSAPRAAPTWAPSTMTLGADVKGLSAMGKVLGSSLISRKEEFHASMIAAEKQGLLLRPGLRSSSSRDHMEKDNTSNKTVSAPNNPKYLQGYLPHGAQTTAELTLHERMRQLGESRLESGVAPMFGGGMARLAEEFAEACGFTAALGPLVLSRAVAKKSGGGPRQSRRQASIDYIWTCFRAYWDEHVVNVEENERLYRLLDTKGRGYLLREDLQPVVLTIARHHRDLAGLSDEELTIYVDTVMATIFYYNSTCGVIRLSEMRKNGLAGAILKFEQWELSNEIMGYTHADPQPRLPYAQREKVRRIWSLARYWELRRDFLILCSDGWNVKFETLRCYAQGGERPVGDLRAKRAIDAGLRPFSPGQSPGNLASAGGGYGRHLDYDSFVCFFLCEKALRHGVCTERDMKYCFNILDECGEGELDLGGLDRYFGEMMMTQLGCGRRLMRSFQIVTSRYLDVLGVGPMRGFLTLRDVLKPRHVELAGRFLEEIFSGKDFEGPLRLEVYPQKAIDFERELALICSGSCVHGG